MEYSWLIYAVLSAFFAGVVSIFGKVGLRDVDPNIASLIRVFVMFVFLLIIVMFQGKFLESVNFFLNKKGMFFIVLSAIAGALSWIFYFFALKIGEVTKVVSIDKLSIVFAVVLAFVFLNEKINFKTGFGLLMMIIGSILVSIN